MTGFRQIGRVLVPSTVGRQMMPAGARLDPLTPHPIDAVPASITGGVVAIGNFDGLHRGHAAIIARALDEATQLDVPAVALTFEPHPRTFFRPEKPVFRLSPLPAKRRLLTAAGIGGLAVANFDRAFADLTPEDFTNRVLAGRLKVRAVVVGQDFRFGKERAGSAETLSAIGRERGFAVAVVEPVKDETGVLLSSTRIRERLVAGEAAEANRLLGHRWFVLGTVTHGEKRGRTLGFPTANMVLPSDCRPREGIYAVKLQRADGSIHDGVASYGRRPQFGAGDPLLEVYVFDFSGNLYGEEVRVTFIDWIRPEAKFASVEALIEAIGEDSRKARTILARAGEGTALDQALAAVA